MNEILEKPPSSFAAEQSLAGGAPAGCTDASTPARTARRILYRGPRGALWRELTTLAEFHGDELHLAPVAGRFDLVIDHADGDPEDLRARFTALANGVGHFVFISSNEVYPPNRRIRPWETREIEVFSEQHPATPPDSVRARAMEREARLLAARAGVPVTVLRPALVDDLDDAASPTRWFTRRVVEGGVLVLPAGDLPSHRLLSNRDLARAIFALALDTRSHGKTLNVSGPGVLDPWAHALLVRDALALPLKVEHVPAGQWRAAGLSLPTAEDHSRAFLAPSPLLRELGWQPEDPAQLVGRLAKVCEATLVSGTDPLLAQERHLAAEVRATVLLSAGAAASRGTGEAPAGRTRKTLRAWVGQPGSLLLQHAALPNELPTPTIKVHAIAIGPAETKLMRGEFARRGSRILGHNSLVEVLASGDADLPVGARMLTVGAMGCGVADCAFCRNGARGVLGVDANGFALGVGTAPASHLLPAPATLGLVALLADPLAALTHALAKPLAAGTGPVWITGRSVEAALAAWLAEDAGRPVVHVDRRARPKDPFPAGQMSVLLQEVRDKKREAPTLGLDFAGDVDLTWPLTQALVKGSVLHAHSRPIGIHQGITWKELPVAAPDRRALAEALDKLLVWAPARDLAARIGPAVPADRHWDAFLPSPFSLPHLEDLS